MNVCSHGLSVRCVYTYGLSVCSRGLSACSRGLSVCSRGLCVCNHCWRVGSHWLTVHSDHSEGLGVVWPWFECL